MFLVESDPNLTLRYDPIGNSPRCFDRVNNLIAKANVDPLDLAYFKLPFDLWDQSQIDTLSITMGSIPCALSLHNSWSY